MSVKFYKRKPKFLEAIQLVDTEESIKQCYAFTKNALIKYHDELREIIEQEGTDFLDNHPYLMEEVHEAKGLPIAPRYNEEEIVPFGCWIIKNTKGDFYWLTDEVFRDLYEVV